MTTPDRPDAAPATPIPIPTWRHELELHAEGYRLIAGVDEAGRGAWAGPLVAAAVLFPHPGTFDSAGCADEAVSLADELGRLRDSKLLAPGVREELLVCIRKAALVVGVGVVSSALIDVIGVGAANRLAMARAVRDLDIWPDYLLLDAFRVPLMPLPQRAIIKGDATCMSVAAASVVAKVTRDRMMCALAQTHPGYCFEQHKGYGTELHQASLARLGVSPVHRRSYAPIKALMDDGRGQGSLMRSRDDNQASSIVHRPSSQR